MSISVSEPSATPRQAASVLRLVASADADVRSVRPGEPGWFEAWQDPSSWECLGSSRRSWADDVIDGWHRRRRASRRRTSGSTALPAGAPALRLV